MKIDDTTNNIQQISSLDTSSNKNIEDDKNSNVNAEKNLQPDARVELSDRSVEVTKVAEAMEAVSTERAQRLEEIKSMIEKDTYEVDSKKIADGIIQDIISGTK